MSKLIWSDMYKKFICIFLLAFVPLFSAVPFSHDLHVTSISGKNPQVVIAAHGMGGNYKIGHNVKSDKTVISFNFPDYDLHKRSIKPEEVAFGTVDEILPLLYVIQQCVIIDGNQEIDLYGFSAGGGAVINAIGALNTNRFDDHLEKIGIDRAAKGKMLAAIQKGTVLLDAPLKSINEIIAFRGASKDLVFIEKKYRANDMEPIDAIKYLKGLSLNVIVYFQNPDEVLSNRDDELFYERLKNVNSGNTELIIGRGAGHSTPHPLLWETLSSRGR